MFRPFLPLLILKLICLFGGKVFAGLPDVSVKNEVFELENNLKAIRDAAQSPEEKVAVIAEWVKQHPISLPSKAARAEMPALVRAPLTEDDRLRQEILSGLKEARAMARTPQEAVALIDEFKRINAQAIGSVSPSFYPYDLSVKCNERIEQNLRLRQNNEIVLLFLKFRKISADENTPEEIIRQKAFLAESINRKK